MSLSPRDRLSSSLALAGSIVSLLSYVEATLTGTWTILPMNVQPYLSDDVYVPSTVPVLFGTPPQQLNLTVDVSSGALAAYGTDCVLCAGTTLFDSSLSSTFETNDAQWYLSTPSFGGVDVFDTVSFEGILSATNQSFGKSKILNGWNSSIEEIVWNGHLGTFLNPLNTTNMEQHIFTRLYDSSSLLNPVIGMRFDPANSKMTIGALDPNDYEGIINWVELNPSPDPHGEYFNTFNIDGFKGYDDQFLPYGSPLSAALDSFWLSISVPDVGVYFNNTSATGPVPQPIQLNPSTGTASYSCNSSLPYVAFTTTINGVDYPIDSSGSLLRAQSQSFNPGYCSVGISNRTDSAQPSSVLGLPFLRSVYVAYRFPTGDCPGYYGFAFPSGSNRTQSQISQTPSATPTNSAQCLSLATPASTPTPNVVLIAGPKGTYTVYGEPDASQVPLMGVNDLPKMAWNWTATSA